MGPEAGGSTGAIPVGSCRIGGIGGPPGRGLGMGKTMKSPKTGQQPRVNIQKAVENHHATHANYVGKSTISTGPFSTANC